MARFYLIRHTTPDIAQTVCYGQTDMDVAASFAAEAEIVRAQIPPGLPILSSPLLRCRRLAVFLAGHQDVATDARLKELNFGDWEGQEWDAIDRAIFDHWAADFVDRPPPGGETLRQVAARMLNCLHEIRQDHVIVSHAGPIRAAIAHHRQLPLTDFGKIPLDYGAVTVLDWTC